MALDIRAPAAGSHWRDSARPVKFFIVDAQAGFPILLFLVHIRMWTLVLAVIAMLFFTLLNRFGFSVIVFARLLRSVAAGNRKIAKPWWQ
jgi:intracellular multiplication protein IcmT